MSDTKKLVAWADNKTSVERFVKARKNLKIWPEGLHIEYCSEPERTGKQGKTWNVYSKRAV